MTQPRPRPLHRNRSRKSYAAAPTGVEVEGTTRGGPTSYRGWRRRSTRRDLAGYIDTNDGKGEEDCEMFQVYGLKPRHETRRIKRSFLRRC